MSPRPRPGYLKTAGGMALAATLALAGCSGESSTAAEGTVPSAQAQAGSVTAEEWMAMTAEEQEQLIADGGGLSDDEVARLAELSPDTADGDAFAEFESLPAFLDVSEVALTWEVLEADWYTAPIPGATGGDGKAVSMSWKLTEMGRGTAPDGSTVLAVRSTFSGPDSNPVSMPDMFFSPIDGTKTLTPASFAVHDDCEGYTVVDGAVSDSGCRAWLVPADADAAGIGVVVTGDTTVVGSWMFEEIVP